MTTSRQTYHHGDLREALLSAAERMIDADLARRFSLRELAREAEVSHAAPYKHFADRDELVLALARRWMADFVAAQAAAVGTGDPRRDLLALGAAYVDYAVAHPSRFLTIFDPAVNRPGNAVSPEFDALVAAHTALLGDTVSAAVAAGIIPGGASVAAALWAQAHGLATLTMLGYLPPSGVAESLSALLRED